MSYTFRVVFDGVTGYVPNQPFFSKVTAADSQKDASAASEPSTKPSNRGRERWEVGKGVKSMAVLLPDLRRPERPQLPKQTQLKLPVFREPHFPLLGFHLDDLREGTTRRVDLVVRDISEKNESGLLFLRREQIRFKLQAENSGSGKFSFADWIPDDPWQTLPRLDRPEQVESLWWLPDLDRVADPKKIKVRPDVLPSFRGPFPQELIARIECTGGRLRTYDFNRNVDGVPLQWRFAEPSDAEGRGSWNRALANSVALEFFDVTGSVQIELKRLANEVVEEVLVLAPAPGASRPVLEIRISNREPDLLFQQQGFGRLTLPDVDFQPFYEKLCDGNLDVAAMPIPHPAHLSFFGIQEKPCAGTVIHS